MGQFLIIFDMKESIHPKDKFTRKYVNNLLLHVSEGYFCLSTIEIVFDCRLSLALWF